MANPPTPVPSPEFCTCGEVLPPVSAPAHVCKRIPSSNPLDYMDEEALAAVRRRKGFEPMGRKPLEERLAEAMSDPRPRSELKPIGELMDEAVASNTASPNSVDPRSVPGEERTENQDEGWKGQQQEPEPPHSNPIAHCTWATSDMTPCALKDGAMALAGDGYCVACNRKFSVSSAPPASEEEFGRGYLRGFEAAVKRCEPTGLTRCYPPNFGEVAQGITSVVLPLGSMDAIERLARDLVAFGFGMGQAAPKSSEQLKWFTKSEAAKRDLLRNALARELAVDPSWSTPENTTGVNTDV